MKKFYIFFFLLPITGNIIYSQNAIIKIGTDSLCNPSILLNDKTAKESTDSGRNENIIGLIPNASIEFELEKSTCDYVIKIQTNDNEIKLKNEDFVNGVLTATNNKLKGMDLTNKFSVFVISSDKPIKANFVITNKPLPITPKFIENKTKEYKPGIIFYDAFALSSPQSLKYSDFIKIMRYYINDNINDISKAINSVQKNSFLKEVLNDRYKTLLIREKSAQSAVNLPFSVLSPSSFGGVNVTNIADGFAKFLVKRTKEELAINFFDKFKEIISSNDYKDIRTLFPETYNTLNAIGDQIYQYNAYMQTLRESFEKDLNELIANLPSITENHQVFFRKHRELEALIKSGCYFAEALKYNKNPGDILNDYPTEYLDSLNPNWKGAIQTLQLLSESLRDTSQSDNASYWVSASQIKKLISDSTTFKIYLGLIYEQAAHFDNGKDPIRFRDSTLQQILYPVGNKFSNYYSSYKSYFTQFSTRLEKVNTIIEGIRKTTNDSLQLEQYYGLINASIDFLQSASDIGKLTPWKPDDNSMPAFFKDIKDSLSSYFDIVSSAAHIAWDIKRRSYASALVNVAGIYNIIRKGKSDLEAKIRKLGELISKSNNAEKQKLEHSLNELINQKNDIINSTSVMNSLIKYGTFMATIVQAKNSDQVEEAIEAFALPAGSSEIKRESVFNVSLNSYVGLFIGKENITGIYNKTFFNNSGVAATIGIAISEGHSFLFIPCSTLFFSTSAFISILDLGAITSYRFTNNGSENLPTIQLKDIISPGLFLSFGLNKTPISLNFGYQIGPRLREVDSTQVNISNAYSRWSVSVCVDIPLLDFYTNP